MVYITILYARLKRLKIDAEGYFDTLDRFDISERLCTAVNNIQFVQEALMNVPKELQFDLSLLQLEKELSNAPDLFAEKKNRVSEILALVVVEVEKELGRIIGGIANRIRPEVRQALEETFVTLQHGPGLDPEPLAPLLTYLEFNLNVLHTALLHVNFARFLQMFWVVICEELCAVAAHFPATTTAEQREFFSRLNAALPPLILYFQGNGEGITDLEINAPAFTAALDFIQMFTMETKDLIAKYFMTRAAEQIVSSRSHLNAQRFPIYMPIEINIFIRIFPCSDEFTRLFHFLVIYLRVLTIFFSFLNTFIIFDVFKNLVYIC
jgi:BAI1-associated protein 3